MHVLNIFVIPYFSNDKQLSKSSNIKLISNCIDEKYEIEIVIFTKSKF